MLLNILKISEVKMLALVTKNNDKIIITENPRVSMLRLTT